MKLKKLMALGMAAVMTLSLAACGGKDDSSSSSNNNSSSDNNAASNDTSNDDAANNDAANSDSANAETPSNDAAGTDSGVPTYASINLGTDYTDLTASIKFMHHKTDREEDGTMANLVAEFNKTYPNIKVETEGITDYAQTALLRLPTGDWGDIMFIPTVDMVDLPTYFVPFGTVDEMSEFINFADNWTAMASDILVMHRDFFTTRQYLRQQVLQNFLRLRMSLSKHCRKLRTIPMQFLFTQTMQHSGQWADSGMHCSARLQQVMKNG